MKLKILSMALAEKKLAIHTRSQCTANMNTMPPNSSHRDSMIVFFHRRQVHRPCAGRPAAPAHTL